MKQNDILDKIKERILQSIDNDFDFQSRNIFNIKLNNKTILIKINGFKFSNKNFIILIIDDISLQSKMESLKEINLFKQKILSCITHNLKTPLNGIIPLIQSALKANDISDI